MTPPVHYFQQLAARPSRSGAGGVADRPARGVAAMRFRAVLLLCMWLAATGTHWDIVQVFAWTRMWVENVKTESAGEALSSTFAPERMCSLCKTVQAAKNAADDDTVALDKILEKATLLPLTDGRGVVVAPPNASGLRHAETRCPPSLRKAPPLPPPRGAA